MESGAYSATGRLQVAAASIATPRTWPSFSADLALAEKKTSSIATQSGSCSVISADQLGVDLREPLRCLLFLVEADGPHATWISRGARAAWSISTTP